MPHLVEQRLITTAENVAVATELGDPAALCNALIQAGLGRAELGDVNAVFETADQIMLIGNEYGFGAYRPYPLHARVWKALHEGRLQEAEELNEETFRAATDTYGGSAFAFYTGYLLAIRRDQGRLEEIAPIV